MRVHTMVRTTEEFNADFDRFVYINYLPKQIVNVCTIEPLLNVKDFR